MEHDDHRRGPLHGGASDDLCCIIYSFSVVPSLATTPSTRLRSWTCASARTCAASQRAHASTRQTSTHSSCGSQVQLHVHCSFFSLFRGPICGSYIAHTAQDASLLRSTGRRTARRCRCSTWVSCPDSRFLFLHTWADVLHISSNATPLFIRPFHTHTCRASSAQTAAAAICSSPHSCAIQAQPSRHTCTQVWGPPLHMSMSLLTSLQAAAACPSRWVSPSALSARRTSHVLRYDVFLKALASIYAL